MQYSPVGDHSTVKAAKQVIQEGKFLKTGKGGYIRLFIPEASIPLKTGSALAKAFGLWKYNGKNLGDGFVLTTDFPERDLERCLARLKTYKETGVLYR